MTTTAGEFDDLQWRNPAPHAAPAAAVTATRAAVVRCGFEWDEKLHDTLQALKATADPAERKHLVEKAIAILRRFEQPNAGNNRHEP